MPSSFTAPADGDLEPVAVTVQLAARAAVPRQLVRGLESRSRVSRSCASTKTLPFAATAIDRGGVHHVSKIWVVDNEPSQRYPIYTRGNVGEVFPEAVAPLSWTLAGIPAAEPGWRDALVRFGAFDLDEFEADNLNALGVFGGYCYLNVSDLPHPRRAHAGAHARAHGPDAVRHVGGAALRAPPHRREQRAHRAGPADAAVDPDDRGSARAARRPARGRRAGGRPARMLASLSNEAAARPRPQPHGPVPPPLRPAPLHHQLRRRCPSASSSRSAPRSATRRCRCGSSPASATSTRPRRRGRCGTWLARSPTRPR